MRGPTFQHWTLALLMVNGALMSDGNAAKAKPKPKVVLNAKVAPATANKPDGKMVPTATQPAPTTTTVYATPAPSSAPAQAPSPPPVPAPVPAAVAPTVAPAAPVVPPAPPRPAPGSVMVSTLIAAGDSSGYQDGPGTVARFDTVEGAALIGNDLYVSDANGSDVIRRVNLQSGDVSTLVGKQRESNTVDGSFAESRFLKPGPMVAVGTTLYVIQLATEHGGACIRSIDLAAQRTATITGNCQRKGNLDGPKDSALFSSPRAMVTDGQNLYVADSVRVRAVALANGTVTTLAGEADAQCDFGLQKICKGGWVDGVGNEARFESIRSLALADRNLYIADGDAIRMLDLNSRKVTTVIGSRKSEHGGDDGVGAKAGLTSVKAITKAEGGLYILQGPYFAGLRYLNLSTNALISLTGITIPPFVRGNSDVDGPATKANFVNPKHLVTAGSRVLIIQERGRIRSFEKF